MQNLQAYLLTDPGIDTPLYWSHLTLTEVLLWRS